MPPQLIHSSHRAQQQPTIWGGLQWVTASPYHALYPVQDWMSCWGCLKAQSRHWMKMLLNHSLKLKKKSLAPLRHGSVSNVPRLNLVMVFLKAQWSPCTATKAIDFICLISFVLDVCASLVNQGLFIQTSKTWDSSAICSPSNTLLKWRTGNIKLALFFFCMTENRFNELQHYSRKLKTIVSACTVGIETIVFFQMRRGLCLVVGCCFCVKSEKHLCLKPFKYWPSQQLSPLTPKQLERKTKLKRTILVPKLCFLCRDTSHSDMKPWSTLAVFC